MPFEITILCEIEISSLAGTMMSPRWKGSYCEQQVYQSRGNKDSVFMQMPLVIKAGEGRGEENLDWTEKC